MYDPAVLQHYVTALPADQGQVMIAAVAMVVDRVGAVVELLVAVALEVAAVVVGGAIVVLH